METTACRLSTHHSRPGLAGWLAFKPNGAVERAVSAARALEAAGCVPSFFFFFKK